MFVSVTGIVRHLGSDMPAIEAAFIRYGVGSLLMIPMMRAILTHRPAAKTMKLFAARSVVHAVGVMLWFFAMARVPIAEVTAIGYISPIFVTIGAAIWFGERLYARRIMAVAVGIFGAMIIIRPGFQEVSVGQLAQLCAAPMFAMSFLLAKKLTEQADTAVIVGMLSLGCTVMLLPGALIQWRDPTWNEVGWLALTAAFATAGHYTLTRAFRAAPLTVTQPVGFLQLVWAALMGVLVFGEAVDPFVFIGGGVVVAAATYISHREAAAARRMRTPPAVATKL
jgi:drug/metabolite transporter (DMT)-like permease